MNISKLKIAFKYLFGGMESVVDYLLDIANAALAAIDPDKRAKIAAAYNTLCKVLATLTALAWLVPTRWQSAYRGGVRRGGRARRPKDRSGGTYQGARRLQRRRPRVARRRRAGHGRGLLNHQGGLKHEDHEEEASQGSGQG